MNRSTVIFVIGICFALVMGADAATKKAAHAGGAKSLTGCLEKGAEANTYKLTHVEGGMDWELIGAPASLNISEHVGHKVTVSGTAVGAAAAHKMEHGAGGGKEMKEEKEEHHLKVSSLKHVAPTCP